MKVTLFEFQKAALSELREKLTSASKAASIAHPQAVTLAAPTGSGKTIMMTALFEAILDEPDEQLEWPADWKPQPDAAILWLSDIPALNEQTKRKIEATSDRIFKVNQLIVIESSFDAELLEGGRVYFMNTQKLGTDKLLTKVGDGRDFSIWTTLSNTAKEMANRFYVVIDEAHRGMSMGKEAEQAQTLVQRFLLGFPDVGMVRMPLVVGISATPKRFAELLQNAPHTVAKVTVPAEDVRASGLLKDRILIHHPESTTAAEIGLLEEAARCWAKMTKEWGDYCKAQGDSVIWPILVVQIENGTPTAISRTNLTDALDAIERAIGRKLNPNEVAHAIHNVGDLDVGGRKVRVVPAERIEEDKDVGVVLFKTSLSTGWDCPRAEVMMSFRTAEDHTYIAQLLGRMVRTPLARRIEDNATLNDVHLYVPHFDSKAVQAVIADLHNVENVPPADVGSGRDMVVLQRAPDSEAIFATLGSLVTYRVNAARVQSNLRRYLALAHGLTHDGIDTSTLLAAKEKALDWLDTHLASMKAKGEFASAEAAITKVALRTLSTNESGGDVKAASSYVIDASDTDIDRLFDDAGRSLSHGLHKDYWRRHQERNALDVKVEGIVLAGSHAVRAAIETVAGIEFDALYDANKKAIGQLPEAGRAAYEQLRLASAKPAEVSWHLPSSISFRRGKNAPEWERHIYLEDDHKFRTDLGAWESGVLKEELADPAVVGWLRNIERKPWSLEIPYESGGSIRPMFPDLVVVRQAGKGYSVDVLEPHDASRSDNFEKAVGLARFGERHGHLFGRIQLIRKLPSPAGGKHFARLEINKEAVRKALLLVTSNPQLDNLFEKRAG